MAEEFKFIPMGDGHMYFQIPLHDAMSDELLHQFVLHGFIRAMCALNVDSIHIPESIVFDGYDPLEVEELCDTLIDIMNVPASDCEVVVSLTPRKNVVLRESSPQCFPKTIVFQWQRLVEN